MKRDYNYLVDINKIIDCYNDIKKNTKNKEKLINFDLFISSNIISIYNILNNKIYKHNKYNIFIIYKPKIRIVMSEILEDKIINHLVSKYYLLPLIEPKLIYSNVATRVNKGTKEGIRLLKKYLNNIKLKHNKFYILKIDIKKYFFNIDHEILLNKLNKIILDKDIFNLIKNIIDSTNEEYINNKINKLINDKEYLYKQGKGLNIGSMSSQILAIFYLNDIDHYIKEKLKIKYYIRYMDDFLLIHYDYNYLLHCLENIKLMLRDLKLSTNNKTRIYNSKEGFEFLGYKLFIKKKRLIIKVRYRNKVSIRRKLNYLKKNNIEKYNRVLSSYKGYLKDSNVDFYKLNKS